MNKVNLKKHSKRINSKKNDIIDYSDIPELTDDFFKKATLRMPTHKSPVTLRIDNDVLNWFKKMGKGYQTRINSLLRQYMQTHQQD